jgi:hypothetical protein
MIPFIRRHTIAIAKAIRSITRQYGYQSPSATTNIGSHDIDSKDGHDDDTIGRAIQQLDELATILPDPTIAKAIQVRSTLPSTFDLK